MDTENFEATYVLELENGKFYVGKSRYLKERLCQHFSGNGSIWTKLYKPLAVIDVFPRNCEEEATLHYMSKYGIDNVRGFSWCHATLSKYGLSNITEKIDLYSEV